MATLPIRQQRCWNHSLREAVSRCPECKRSFCRECVTEFEGRVLCAPCLSLATKHEEATRKWPIARVGTLLGFTGGLLLTWWTFFTIGRLLASMPSSFHGGTP